MLGRIFVIAWKELLQLRRDRLTLAMIVALPLLQLLLFGYAINTDVRHVQMAVYDQDRSPLSRDFVRRLEVTGFLDVVGHVDNYWDAQRALESSRARAVVVVPLHFDRNVRRGVPTRVQFLADGSETQTVSSALQTAAGVASSYSAELRGAANLARGMPPIASADLVSIESSVWFNPELRTAVFIVPGLAGVLLTLTMVMFTSMAITRERERGTLEQLMVSPIRGAELILGKIAPYVAIGYLQLSLILLAARLVFRVRLAGSMGELYLIASLFIAGNLALGLVLSTVAKTQQQAMQMSFFFLLPNILLSGFMFPWEAMPRPIQNASQLLPLTHFLRIIRGIALKGTRLSELGTEIVWLSAVLALFVVVAAARFRKKLA